MHCRWTQSDQKTAIRNHQIRLLSQWGPRHCLDSCHISLDLAWGLVNGGHIPLACGSLWTWNPFLQGKTWIWWRIHGSVQQPPTWPFKDALPLSEQGKGPRASAEGLEKSQVHVWSKKSGVMRPGYGKQLHHHWRKTSRVYKSHTARIHASNQTEVERPSLLKAATVMQEDKLWGQLQSVCPTTPQHQRVRSEWEGFLRKNTAALVQN